MSPVAKAGFSTYDVPWDAGNKSSGASDFHAEDTIIPDFMPSAAAAADTAAPSMGTAAPNTSSSTRYGRMLWVVLFLVLLAGGSAYFLLGASERRLPEPAPAIETIAQPADLPLVPEGRVEAEVAALADATDGNAPLAPAEITAVQAEVTPFSPPTPVVEQPERKVVPKETVQRKPVPAQATPPAPRAEAARPWQAALRAELAGCDRESFFSRIACREKVRWRYCAPDRWNTAPGCEANASQQ